MGWRRRGAECGPWWRQRGGAERAPEGQRWIELAILPTYPCDDRARGMWDQVMSPLGFPTSLCVNRVRSGTLSKDARSVVQSSGSHRPRCCDIVGVVKREACVSIDAIDTTVAFGAHLDDGVVLGALTVPSSVMRSGDALTRIGTGWGRS
jgi:hypothetical protein